MISNISDASVSLQQAAAQYSQAAPSRSRSRTYSAQEETRPTDDTTLPVPVETERAPLHITPPREPAATFTALVKTGSRADRVDVYGQTRFAAQQYAESGQFSPFSVLPSIDIYA